jgi:hypothetical protein
MPPAAVIGVTQCLCLVILDMNDPLGARAGAAPREVFRSRRHVKRFDGDVSIVVERIKVRRDGRATRVANAFSLFDIYLHATDFTVGRHPQAEIASADLALMAAPGSVPESGNRIHSAGTDAGSSKFA